MKNDDDTDHEPVLASSEWDDLLRAHARAVKNPESGLAEIFLATMELVSAYEGTMDEFARGIPNIQIENATRDVLKGKRTLSSVAEQYRDDPQQLQILERIMRLWDVWNRP